MIEHKAVVALYHGNFAGFSYIESWSNKMFVANSGLIVSDAFRGIGLAKRIKNAFSSFLGNASLMLRFLASRPARQ